MARALGTGTARGIETAAAFVAMTFLFSYLRRPSFMAVVYPVATGQTGELGRFTEPAMPLAVFAVSLGLLALWRRGRSLEGVLVAAGPLGSLGVALALLAQAGVLPTVWIWVSGLLCAVGFVGAVVLAGRVLCARGMLWSAGVVVVAYLVNFALFLALRQSSWLQPAVLCTPLLAASSWLLISDARMGGRRERGALAARCLERAAPVAACFAADDLRGDPGDRGGGRIAQRGAHARVGSPGLGSGCNVAGGPGTGPW